MDAPRIADLADEHLAALDAADTCHDAGTRRVVTVHVPRRKRRKLEEGRAGVQQSLDALPDVTNNQVVVLTKAPGFTPEEVETRVTRRVEHERLTGARRIRDVPLAIGF